jgi:hypothetical protein
MPKDFFNQLGDYVYKYVDSETGELLYIGKGSGSRCRDHVDSKGYNIEDCVIVARNLEKFTIDEKKDHSFALESFLIATYKPRDNIVSGQYKECFIMKGLNFLFDEYKDAQRDMFEESNTLRKNLEEQFPNSVSIANSRTSSYLIESSGNKGMYFGIKVQAKEKKPTVYVKVKDESQFEVVSKGLTENLGKDYELDSTSNKGQVSWFVEDINEALEFWGTTV